MLKLKYYTLNKEEKKNIKNEFYETEFGLNIKKRLDRVFIIGILGILFSLYLIIFPTSKLDTIMGILLIISSFVFIFGEHKVRIEKINNYLVKKKK